MRQIKRVLKKRAPVLGAKKNLNLQFAAQRTVGSADTLCQLF